MVTILRPARTPKGTEARTVIKHTITIRGVDTTFNVNLQASINASLKSTIDLGGNYQGYINVNGYGEFD